MNQDADLPDEVYHTLTLCALHFDGWAFDPSFLRDFGIPGPREVLAYETGNMSAGIMNEAGASLHGAMIPALTRNQVIHPMRDYRGRPRPKVK